MTIALRPGGDNSDRTVIRTAVDPADGTGLRLAMRRMAGGVCVVTAGTGQDRTGATVTSATALSVDPPTMIVNINKTSSTYPVIGRHGHFCVNILTSEQQDIADRFAGKGGLKGPERYTGADWFALSSGAAALSDAVASIDCVVEEILERHSHAIIIGRVVSIATGDGSALVYSDGRYGHFLAGI